MTISLRVANDKTSKDFIKETITKYHSYVPSNSSVGRRIDWVVFNDDVPVGMIGIGSSVYPPPKDILTHTKLSMKEYKDNFNSFASNWRFCMREKIKNAGTQILKELRRQAPLQWKEKYNDDKRRVFSIITKAANLNINKIHHRMPVVLNANAAQDYLELKDDNLNFNNFEDVDLKFTEVSKYVNSPKNNDEKCIATIN